jgi:hypothetical protein
MHLEIHEKKRTVILEAINEIQANFTLEQVTKAQRGSRGIAILFL